MRVDYRYGGFYIVKRVRCNFKQGVSLMDYEIMIENTNDLEAVRMLQKLDDRSTREYSSEDHVDPFSDANQFVELHEVSNYLNGIGRIIQYQSNDDECISDPHMLYLQGVYEGQIKNGKAHGFGRMIYGQRHHVFTGYFD